MDLTPFIDLPAPRAVAIPWLPPVLREFYERHEGIGRDGPPDLSVRLCRLDDVSEVGLRDLHLFENFPLNAAWAGFSAIRIGVGMFFDEIVYVVRSPVCPPASIMAFGADVFGPGGEGDDENDPCGSVVLARSFGEWMDRLKTDGWKELGLVPGVLARLPIERATKLRKRFAELNPRCDWSGTRRNG
jgi:hypothetical protein